MMRMGVCEGVLLIYISHIKRYIAQPHSREEVGYWEEHITTWLRIVCITCIGLFISSIFGYSLSSSFASSSSSSTCLLSSKINYPQPKMGVAENCFSMWLLPYAYLSIYSYTSVCVCTSTSTILLKLSSIFVLCMTNYDCGSTCMCACGIWLIYSMRIILF